MQTHYNFVFDSITNSYSFITKNNILYRIYLVEDHTFSSISGKVISNIFQIVIEKITKQKEPLDITFSNTIEIIINQFFKKTENSLLYFCQNTDDKGKIRFDVFDRWYNKSTSQKHIQKITKIIEINIGKGQVEKLFTAFLFHKKNPNYKFLLKIYNQIENVLNSSK